MELRYDLEKIEKTKASINNVTDMIDSIKENSQNIYIEVENEITPEVIDKIENLIMIGSKAYIEKLEINNKQLKQKVSDLKDMVEEVDGDIANKIGSKNE